MFVRLLVSYILVILIPVSLLFIILYQSSVINLRTEMEAFNISNLYKVRDTLDVRIKEYNSIAAQISLNPKLAYYNMVSDDYKSMEGIQELGKYKAGNAVISDILIHYNSEANVFSSNGLTSVDVILDTRYKLPEESRALFHSSLNQLGVPLLRTFAGSELIMYFVPLPVSGVYHYSTAIFVFKGNSVEKMISEGRTNFEGSTYVLDAAKNIILSVDKFIKSPEEDFLSVVRDHIRPGINTFTYGDDNYSLITVMSEETGWHYITVLPTKQFLKKVTSQQFFIVISTIVVLLLCVLVALTLAFSNYKPIRRLNTLVRDHLPPPHKKGSDNEIENISSAVSSAIALNQTLTGQLDYHRLVLKQNVLIRLLKGETGDREELFKLVESSGIRLAGPMYGVLVVHGDAEDEEAARLNREMIDFISLRYSIDGKAYAVEFGSENSMVIIANLDELDTKAELSQMAEVILAFYQDNIGSHVSVGIGKSYEDMIKINHSYIEACAAVDYEVKFPFQQESPEYSSIKFLQDISTVSHSYWQPTEDEMVLFHSLKQGDRTLALDALERMLQDLQTKPVPASVK
jgi:hypothetical protein